MSAVNLELLEETLADEPAYRSRQVWEWVARGASSYDEMTNLPAGLRSRLGGARAVLVARGRRRDAREGPHAEGALPHARPQAGSRRC